MDALEGAPEAAHRTPSAVVVGFDDDLVRAIETLGWDATRVDDLTEVSLDSTVMIIAGGHVELADDGPYLLLIGDSLHDGRDGVGRVSSLAQVELSRLDIEDDAPEAFMSAINGLRLSTVDETAWFSGLTFTEHTVARPLVTSGGTTVVALYDRGEGVGLAVPAAAEPIEWFRAFAEHIHNLDPDRVPYSPPRVARPDEWRTASELEVMAQLQRIDEEIAELARWREEAAASLLEATQDAELGERWLLWADSDELVGSVRMTLEELGFRVEEIERDDREQLQVLSDEHPDWVGIVDTSACDGAVSVSELRRVNQHLLAYVAECGSQPDSVWWVVNDHRRLDPSRRPDSFVDLSDALGLVDVMAVSTRDLFRLGRDVARERLDPEAARKLLTSPGPGVFAHPQQAHEDGV